MASEQRAVISPKHATQICSVTEQGWGERGRVYSLYVAIQKIQFSEEFFLV